MQCFGRVESSLGKTVICMFTKLDLVTMLTGLNMACSSLDNSAESTDFKSTRTGKNQ